MRRSLPGGPNAGWRKGCETGWIRSESGRTGSHWGVGMEGGGVGEWMTSKE